MKWLRTTLDQVDQDQNHTGLFDRAIVRSV